MLFLIIYREPYYLLRHGLCILVLPVGRQLFQFSREWFLMMSMMTDYEGGLALHIPMFMHLNIDVLLGVFLALAPWLLGFKDEVYLPHLVIGLFSIFAGLFTVRDSLTERKNR